MWGGLGLVVGLGVVLPAVVAVTTGSIAVPHNDAWAYSKIAQGFAETGSFELLGWNRSALIGQVLPLGPLAASITAQQIAVAVCAAASLLMTALLVARRTSPAWGVVAAAVVAAFPGFGLLATSFMGDVPALTAVLGCLVLGERALVSQDVPSLPALVGSLLVGMWGFTIREQAIAAPVAVVLAVAWRYRAARRMRVMAGAALVLLLGAFGSFESWRGALSATDPPVVSLWPDGWPTLTVRTYLTLALLVSPLVVMGAARSLHSPVRLLMVLTMATSEVAILLWRPVTQTVLPNYLEATGSYSAAAIGAKTVLPAGVMSGLMIVAVISGALLPVVVWDGLAHLGPMLLIFTGLTALGTIGQIVVDQGSFDRYLLASIIPVAVACWRPGRTPPAARILGTMSVSVLFAVSLALTGNGLSNDAAAWHAAQMLVNSGVPATDIDAGFAWTGYHSGGPFSPGQGSALRPGFMAHFADSRACYRVSRSAGDAGEVLFTVPYRTYGLWGSSEITVSRTSVCP